MVTHQAERARGASTQVEDRAVLALVADRAGADDHRHERRDRGDHQALHQARPEELGLDLAGGREHDRRRRSGAAASSPSASACVPAEQAAQREPVDRRADGAAAGSPAHPPGALVQVGVDALQVVAHRLDPRAGGRPTSRASARQRAAEALHVAAPPRPSRRRRSAPTRPGPRPRARGPGPARRRRPPGGRCAGGRRSARGWRRWRRSPRGGRSRAPAPAAPSAPPRAARGRRRRTVRPSSPRRADQLDHARAAGRGRGR